MIKLLALDLDGTLLDSRGKISEKNKKAIRRAEERGVLVTIATGRRFRDARPVALEAEFNAPIVTHNGALLKFAENFETVAFSLIDPETCREIIRVGRLCGGDALVSADPHGPGTLLYDRISAENLPLRKYIAWSRSLHGAGAEDSVRHVDDLDAVIDRTEVVHVSFSGGCRAMNEMQAILEGELGDSVNILATVYPPLDFTLLDILPPGASKGVGVEKLAALHGLTRENVMVCGDNYNDLEMLEYAGTAVVMGNSPPELLENPDYAQTLSNDENGVACAIEKFILNQ
ncbi:MAG: HAD family phosphatase [Acidobacteria bacterium]|nr:HAD family phosphatase [Acidobacteriota bacterium]